MKSYLDLMQRLVEEGLNCPDRTGSGRRKIFGTQLRFNVSDHTLPLVTTREMKIKSVVRETLWFRDGSTSSTELVKRGCKIWENWAVKEEDIDAFCRDVFPNEDEDSLVYVKQALREKYLGSIGSLYGRNWRNAPVTEHCSLNPIRPIDEIASDKLAEYKKDYDESNPMKNDTEKLSFEEYASYRSYETVDQLQEILAGLKKRPFSSRHILSAWIPEFVPFEHLSPQRNVLLGRGALSACHVLQQYIVLPPAQEGGKLRLSLMMTQRSSDYCIGVPSNICQYAMLLMMIAHVSDMEPFEFIWSSGDTHIYFNHVEQAKEQLLREPLPLPKLWLNPEVKDLFAFTEDDIRVDDYQSHPAIKYEISV